MQIKRGELYYATLDPVIGSEQGGKRPVLILQNDIGNKHSPTVVVAAITSRLGKAKLPTHVNLSSEKLSKDSIVLLEQIRTIDKCRLVEYIGKATPEEMEFIEKALLVSVGINKRNDYEV
jgi:mRNA interferase MazF